MFKSWRLQLREAEQAFRAGRLDEAVRLVQDEELRESLPGKRLTAAVADALVRRAEQRLRQEEGAAGWRDLAKASQLCGNTPAVSAARRGLLKQVVSDAERQLAEGKSAAAIKRLELADQHLAGSEEVRTLLEVARRLESARNLRERGKFEEADSQLERAAAIRPDLPLIEQRRGDCRQQAQEARELGERLHQAMFRGDWTESLAMAGKLLELTPKSRLAEEARRRSWLAVGADAQYKPPWAAWQANRKSAGEPQAREVEASGEGEGTGRFLLWVDGVGGFLVCLADEVVLGQATLGNHLAVPILGDLSRQHAIVRREDGYLIEPLGDVWIEGRQIHRATALSDGDEIRLGASVVLRFRQPHPLSATARLELLSKHRTQPSADAVLLMAESCVLGPKWQNHIVCRDWSSDVVLYRRDGALYCRATEGIEVDGRFCVGQEQLAWDSHVAGSDFSLSLEPID